MSPRLSRDEERLLALAREQETATRDPELRDCWRVLTSAIAERWIVPEGRMSLQELIDELERGSGAGAEEYTIDVDEEDDSKVLAVFVDSRHHCPRGAMLRELRRLEQRRRGEPDQQPRQQASAPEELLDHEALRRIVQLLLGARSGELPESEEAERVRRDVRDQFAALASSPEALDSDEMRQAVAGIGAGERTKIAEALRTFAAWAERPEHGGPAVDAAIEALESTLGWLAQGGRVQERETQERVAKSARDAIARRLRDAGLS
jgi:hypothetical protein